MERNAKMKRGGERFPTLNRANVAAVMKRYQTSWKKGKKAL